MKDKMVKGTPPQAEDFRAIVDFYLEAKKVEELLKKRPDIYDNFLNRKIIVEPVDMRKVQEGVVTKIRFRVKKGKSYKEYSTGVDPRNPLASLTFRNAGQPKKMEISRLRLMAILAAHEMMPKNLTTGKTETVIGHSLNLLRALKAKRSAALKARH